MEWYTGVLKKYAEFNGRARRKEFWMFAAINFGIAVVLSIIDAVLSLGSILPGLYYLAVLVPSLAVGFRRMHDIGKSGWWILLPIVNIIFAIQEGVAGPNEHGDDPKAAERSVGGAAA